MPEKSKSPRSRISAGLVMFRRRNDQVEVLLAHPGGPLFAPKDDGIWTIPKGEAAPGKDLVTRPPMPTKSDGIGTIPKGEAAPGEDLLTPAQIEFEEEVGFRPEGVVDWIALGWIKQKGGKIVHAWAFEGDLPESFAPKSNLFELEWPPRSGKRKMFPKINEAG